MARRKRKEEEEAGWAGPEFDEVEFMRREISGARAAIVTVGWSVVGALVSFGTLLVGLHWAISFFVGLFSFAGLYYVFPLAEVKSSAFKRRDWIGHGSTYFFSWLAFWILLLNVPFTDFTAPEIHAIAVGSYATGATLSNDTISCAVPRSGFVDVTLDDTLYLSFRATDNFRLSGVSVQIGGQNQTHSLVANQPNPCKTTGSDVYLANTFVVSLSNPGSGSYPTTIEAWDLADHRVRASFTIRFGL